MSATNGGQPGDGEASSSRPADGVGVARSSPTALGGDDARSGAELRFPENEARYRGLFDQMVAGFALHEAVRDDGGKVSDYRYIDVNPAFETLTGLKRADVVGRTVREVLPDLEPRWIDVYGPVVDTGQPARFIDYTEALDRHYEVVAYRPAPEQFATSFTDVSERIRAEAHLRESEERFRQTVENTSAGYFRIDDRGRFSAVNRAWLDMHGYESADEVLGQDIGLTQTPDGLAAARDVVRQLLAGESFPSGEFSRRRRDGGTAYHRFSAHPVVQNGQVVGAEGFLIDVTEQRRAELSDRATRLRLASLAEMGKMRAISLTVPEICDLLMRSSIQMTRSRFGYVYLYDEETRVLTNYAWSDEVVAASAIVERQTVYELDRIGLWGEAIRQRRPVVTNGYTADASWQGDYPERRVALTRHLNLPIFDGERIVALIGVANKTEPYDEDDVGQLRLLAEGAWHIIQSARAEVALRQAENRYRTLFDQSPYGIVTFDPETMMPLAFNDAAHSMFGYSREEFAALSIFDYDVGARPEVIRAQVARLRNLGSAQFESKTRAKGGEVRDTLISVRLVEISGRPAVLSTYGDITERNQARERSRWESDVQTALAELYRPMASPDTTIDAIARTVLRQAQRLTGSTHGYVSAIDPATDDNVIHTLTDMLGNQCRVLPAGQRISFARGADGRYVGLWGVSLDTGEAFYTNSPASHPAARGVPAGHVPVERFLSVPVTLGSRIVGQIALANPARDFAERDLDAIKRIAEYYALAIQRQRHEDALRAGEERYRGIFENAGNGIAECTIGGQYLRVNERFREIVGYSEEELLRLTWMDLTHPDDVDADADGVARLIGGEIAGFSIDKRYIRKDGSIVWASLQLTAIRDTNGRPIRLVGTSQDVTLRRRASQTIQTQRDLAVALSAASSTREAIDLVLDAAIRVTGLDVGGVYLVDPATGALKLDAWRGLGEHFVCANSFLPLDSPKARSLVRGSTVYLPDLASQSVEMFTPEDRDQGLRAAIVVPVVDHGQLIACLNLGSHSSDEIALDERVAVEMIAAQSGSAIARIRFEEELRDSERRQRDLFEHSPVPTWEEDYSAVKLFTDELRASGVRDLRAHFATYPDDLARCARSIRILRANRAALQFYGTEELADVADSLKRPFHSARAWDVLSDEIASLADGATQFESEKECLTARGEIRNVIVRVSVVSGHERSLGQVLVSFVDITERKRAETSLRNEQEFTRAVLDSVNNGVVACDADGRLATFNRAARDWHGLEALNLSQEEWAGRYDLFRADGSTPLPTDEIPLSRAFAGETVADAAFVIRAKGQPMRELVASGGPVYDDNGQGLGAVIAMRDVTERNRAERTSSRYIQRLELLQELDRRILAAQSSEEIAGFAVRQLRVAIPSDEALLILFSENGGIARALAHDHVPAWPDLSHDVAPLSDFTPPAGDGQALRYYPDLTRLDAPDRAMQVAIAKGARSILTARLVVAGEDLGFVNLASTLVDAFSAEQQEIVREVTNQIAIGLQQARLRERLQRQNDDLEKRVAERTEMLRAANTELDSFAYSVSHDLRAPLRALQGYSTILLEEHAASLDDDGRDFLGRINTSARRMDTLVRDVLTYSRTTRAADRVIAVDLSRAMNEAMQQVEAEIADHGATVEITSGLPMVRANRTALVQVLSNLITNAAKFVAPGVTPEVRISAEAHDGKVRLWVADNGIGIDPADQERIFAAFERLHGVDEYSGSGIGLAIVKKGIERMGGCVGVESQSGVGSRFWIELPGG